MPVIQMPNGDLVDLPDTATPEQLSQLEALAQTQRQGSSAVPEQAPPVNKLKETGRVVDKSIRGGLLAIPGMAADAVSGGVNAWMRNFGLLPNNEAHKLGAPGMPMWPSDALQQMTGGPVSEPETSTGKMLGNVGESVVAGATSGPLAHAGRNALIGLGAGAGAEAAAVAFGDNGVSRIAGALAGGGIPVAARKIWPNNADDIIRTATGKMTDTDWLLANAAKKTADKMGMPSLSSQFLGPRSSMGDVVEAASGNQFVRPDLLSATAKVPEKARAGVENFITANIAPRLESNRDFLGNVQEEAAKTIRNSEKADSALWRSTFDQTLEAQRTGNAEALNAARAELDNLPANVGLSRLAVAKQNVDSAAKNAANFGQVPREALDDTYKRLTTLAGAFPNQQVEKVILNLRNKLKKGDEYITDGSQLNGILQDVRATLDQVGVANPINRRAAGIGKEEIYNIREELGQAFEPIRVANEAFRLRRSQVTEPMEKSLVGQFAQMGGGVKSDKYTARQNALQMMFPKDRDMTQEIRQYAQQTSPETVVRMGAEYLGQALENAVTLSRGAERLQQPFKFVEAVAGTRAQQRNLNEMLKQTAEAYGQDSTAVRIGFYKVMKALESTKNLKIRSSINPVDVEKQAGENVAAFGLAPMSRTARALSDRVTARAYRDITKIIMSPDGLQQLERIAKTPGNAEARAWIFATLPQATASAPADVDE